MVEWGRGLLPCIIGTSIFPKLHISNLPVCRLVCKTWNDLVLDYASFSKLQPLTNVLVIVSCDIVFKSICHPKMYCINLDTIKHHLDIGFDFELELIKSGTLQSDGEWSLMFLRNQCNDLLFVSKVIDGTICDVIFNPMTNEFLSIPGFDFDGLFCFGFGFSPKTNQYKLFRAAEPICYMDPMSEDGDEYEGQESSTIMDVFTFDRSGHNHNEWKYLYTLPFEIIDKGVYLNGVIYWLVKEQDRMKEYVIYALDVETEQIELSTVLQVDPCFGSGDIHQFNGTIYATFYISWEIAERTIQVWRMQEKNSWIREFVINDIPNDWKSCKLIKIFEDGETLCMINRNYFCFYNRFTNKKTIIPTKNQKFRQTCSMSTSLNFCNLPKILRME